MTVADGFRPLAPRDTGPFGGERSKERVVVEPPGLARDEGGEPKGSIRPMRPVVLDEVREGEIEGSRLRAPDVGIANVGIPERGVETAPGFGREAIDATGALEVFRLRQGNVDGIDGHRRTSRIRRRLAIGHRADWQEHQAVEAGRREPVGERHEIWQLADAPALRGGRRKKRKQQTGMPSGHAALPPTTGNSLPTASSKICGSESRLITR